MTRTASILESHNVYRDSRLKQTIIELERAYQVTDEIGFFNDLVNFSRNVNVPYHGWFKYREGYSHILIRHLIERYNVSAGEAIVDPFCGSGTTVVEAALCGYSSFGVDVNPLSAFITNTKVHPYTAEELLLLERALPSFAQPALSPPAKSYEDARQYFGEAQFRELLSIKAAIDAIAAPAVRNLLLLGYLSIIEEVSNRKRDGNGLVTRPGKVVHVIKHYTDKMNAMLNDLRSQSIDAKLDCRAVAGDAASLDDIYRRHANRQVGAIMFSPPYANSFDYFESYKMELLLGDFVESIGGIKQFRDQAVRSFVNTSAKPIAENPVVDALAREIEWSIPDKEALTGKKDNRTRKVPAMIRGYFNDMRHILKECSKLLEPKRTCFIVVDQSAYLGVLVPSDLLLGMIAEEFGLKVKEIIVCRKARTSPQQLQRFPYLSDLLRESIVVLEKH